MNDKIFDDEFIIELKHDFLETSADLLSEFEEILIPMKENNEIALTEIKEIFRIVHTLKGNSNAVGYEKMGSMLHAFENMLAQIHKEDYAKNTQIIDLFFAVLEKAQDTIEIYKKSLNKEIDFSEITDQIIHAFDKAPKGTMTKPETKPETKETKRYKIAVIDDEPAVREVLVTALESEFDADFFEFADGALALEGIKKNKFDLMAVDYKMPNMDGKEFIKKVRETENINSATPVLFISGYNAEVENHKSMTDDIFYIQKPFDLNRIIYYAKCSFIKKK